MTRRHNFFYGFAVKSPIPIDQWSSEVACSSVCAFGFSIFLTETQQDETFSERLRLVIVSDEPITPAVGRRNNNSYGFPHRRRSNGNRTRRRRRTRLAPPRGSGRVSPSDKTRPHRHGPVSGAKKRLKNNRFPLLMHSALEKGPGLLRRDIAVAALGRLVTDLSGVAALRRPCPSGDVRFV